ncbi:MAG TPA: molybdopterin cofactor-binding domain-containing protein, partial [Pseudomonas sp.]|nr:molybdopterin cofactor-binding domain-containing protein [Pseudomonas sp.]
MGKIESAETLGKGILNVSRRGFLKGSSGLALGFFLAPLMRGGEALAATASQPFGPNAFVRIDGDGMVTVLAKHLEMGQGSYTGLATLLAEELDADWDKVRVEGAPADVKQYNNHAFGPMQGTGGSTAMANSWEQMRNAGASARAMLVGAAAQRWGVPASEISVSEGVVSHAASGRKAGFGELVEAAAQLPVPQQVQLKDPKDFKLIGKV